MSATLTRMLDPLRRALTPAKPYDIGLHIGLERVNLMQLQSRAGEPIPTVRAAASLDHGTSRDQLLADPPRLKALLKRAFAEQPFTGRRVVSSLPPDQVKIMQVNYTVAEGATESDSVIRELRERVHEGLEGMVVDYVPVRHGQALRPKEAIVAMAPRDKVMAYLETLSAAGLEVAALDIAPAALARLVSWISPVETSAFPNSLLINFGFRCSYLTIVWGRRLMLDRPIDFAEHRLLARLKNILDIAEPAGKQLLLERGLGGSRAGADDNEISGTMAEVLRPEFAALKAEVNNTLVYTASRTHGRSVDGIYVIGSVARYPGIEPLLKDLLAVPLQLLDPCAVFNHEFSGKPRSGVAAATGFALRGVPVLWPTST